MIHVIKQKWCYDYGKVKLLFIPLIKYFSILKKNVLIKEAVLYHILNLDSTLSTMTYRASIVITDIPRPKLISERHTEANPETARIENNAKKIFILAKSEMTEGKGHIPFFWLGQHFPKVSSSPILHTQSFGHPSSDEQTPSHNEVGVEVVE